MSLHLQTAVIVGLLVICGSLARAQVADKAIGVIVQSTRIQPLENRIEALGNLHANESIRLTSNVTKTVTSIHFEDGQRVKKGDVLVTMTSAEERALLDEARFTADEAQKQLDRVKTLVSSNAASQSLLDQRVREYESARARYLAIAARLQDLTLTAPFSGVVGLRNVSAGALVTPGDLITTLIDDHKMKLDFTLPAIYLSSLRVGLPIVATSAAMGGRTVKGEVYSIDNQIDPVTRAIKVRALLPNKDLELKQGMLMGVEVYTDKRNALVISEAALVPMGNSNFVFVAQTNNGQTILDRRPITIGRRFPGKVEVLSGLNEGDRVVTHGLQKVRAGSVVTITAEDTGEKSLSELLHSPKS